MLQYVSQRSKYCRTQKTDPEGVNQVVRRGGLNGCPLHHEEGVVAGNYPFNKLNYNCYDF